MNTYNMTPEAAALIERAREAFLQDSAYCIAIARGHQRKVIGQEAAAQRRETIRLKRLAQEQS